MSPDTNMPVCDDAHGTLPACAPLAVPYVPFQQTGSKRYNQNEALCNGTLFPGLNLPFQLKTTKNSMASCPLCELQALEFVLVELGLYLDTHQDDSEAFALYQQFVAAEKTAREKYEAANGPLFQKSAANFDAWSAWLKEPWPWTYSEGGK